jgi:serine/threonine protein kinase
MIVAHKHATIYKEDDTIHKKFNSLNKYRIELEFLQKLQHLDMVIHMISYVPKTIILEYVPHVLDDLIICRQIVDTKHILKQLVQFLKHLKDLQIVHNDFKAKNILVCSDRKTIKVIDFELSKYNADNSQDIKKFRYLIIQLMFYVDYVTAYKRYKKYEKLVNPQELMYSTDLEKIMSLLN